MKYQTKAQIAERLELVCVETLLFEYAQLALSVHGKAGRILVDRKIARMDCGILPEYIFLN